MPYVMAPTNSLYWLTRIRVHETSIESHTNTLPVQYCMDQYDIVRISYYVKVSILFFFITIIPLDTT